jgi:predicted metal-dependent TIM-barrel fold hydrolase
MKMFDHHIHMTSRTTDDYKAMADAGILGIIEPAFWLGQPRTHVGSYEDYLLSLVGWERFRARQFGIHHFCTIGLNPREANNPDLAPGVMELLPIYLEKESCVGVGEIGFDDQTPAETRYFEEQMQLAIEHKLPVLIHTPHRDKKRGTEYTIALVKASGIDPGRVLIDHNNEETIKTTLDSGCWAGHSIYPNTKMDEPRMSSLIKKYGTERITINSAADWGVSDPLKVPKTASVMLASGISAADVEKIVWGNPVAFFGQSGRLPFTSDAHRPHIDQREHFEGNSVLRGQQPVVDPVGR